MALSDNIQPATVVTLHAREGDAILPLNPTTVASQVAVNDADGGPSTVEAEIAKLRTAINAAVDQGIHFKGALTSTGGLPTVSYKAGWQYVVKDAGTYAGKACEVGDLVLCIKDYASGSASNNDWTVLQANIVGAVTGPASSTANRVAVFNGTSGKEIKDSGYTIQTSVPPNAQFTDTTYGAATDQADGLMTRGQYSKLAGIEAGADVTDTANVSAAGAFMTASDTADDIADGASKVLMTAEERTKLSGVASGAQVNQNAFSHVQVGTVKASADNTTDTLTFAAGDGISLSVNAETDTVTIAEAYVDSCVVSDLANVPANLRNGGTIFLKV